MSSHHRMCGDVIEVWVTALDVFAVHEQKPQTQRAFRYQTFVVSWTCRVPVCYGQHVEASQQDTDSQLSHVFVFFLESRDGPLVSSGPQGFIAGKACALKWNLII